MHRFVYVFCTLCLYHALQHAIAVRQAEVPVTRAGVLRTAGADYGTLL